MRRLVLVTVLAAAALLAGCGRSSKPGGAVTPASPGSVTVSDPRGDAVDVDGNPRRRPDVDIVHVGIDRNANGTLFQITTAAAPRGRVRYEIFAQSPDVDGYDVVDVLRKGTELAGYFAFENSPARQALTEPQSLSDKGPTVAINVPVDPIFGATPFQWRVSVATAGGARISDTLPSPSGLRSFPSRG